MVEPAAWWEFADVPTEGFAEIPETRAPAEIATIYAAIREALGVPLVDPMFRHMATVDGCLPWAWACLAPFYRGGALHEAGARLALIPQQIAMGRVDLALGLRPEIVADTLSAHLRATPIDTIALLALDRVCRGDATVEPAMLPGTAARLTPIAHVLPIEDLETIPVSSRDKLRSLATLMDGDEAAAVPSLFRHFAAWPTALEAIAKVLRALNRAEALQSVVPQMEALAQRTAARLALTPPAPPDAETTACIRHIADMLPTRMARTIVVAHTLRQAVL